MNISPNKSLKSITDITKKNDYKNLSKSTNIDDDDFGCVKVEVRRQFSQTLSSWHELQEISELDNSCQNPTTASLRRCKKEIIHPFRNLLCLIGWRSFGVDTAKRSSILMRILNIVYPLFVFILLLFNYIYEIIVCQGNLNVATDTKVPLSSIAPDTSTPSLITPSRLPNSSLITANYNYSKTTTAHTDSDVCGHIFTTYIIPDILHCAAFIIGFVYFRITEGEPMYSLMEKVFIHADQNMRLFSPNRVIRRLKLFLLMGSIWVLASVVTHALAIVINDFKHPAIFYRKNGSNKEPVQYSLFIIDIICLLIKNCIHLAVAMNFVSHCELIVFYCKAIRTRLEEKSVQLLEAMKQILDLGSSISQLNGSVSRMMSILIVYFIDRTILGTILFLMNEMKEPLIYVYRASYPIVWFSILIFCLVEASRVTAKCDKFHRITQSVRVYGYHTASPSELDGFLLFISRAELRSKLFGLTVRPGKIISIIVTIMLICVVLLQTNIINSPNFSL